MPCCVASRALRPTLSPTRRLDRALGQKQGHENHRAEVNDVAGVDHAGDQQQVIGQPARAQDGGLVLMARIAELERQLGFTGDFPGDAESVPLSRRRVPR